MKMLDSFYEMPAGRLTRRFVMTGLSAFLPLFVARVGVDPMTFVDNILNLGSGDWSAMAKIAVGAGILSMLDKLRREVATKTATDASSEK